ncbi:hypothetical protein [Anaerorhabdus sp.]|uniref:hypothetical protein n=1 Tax=Anaerorhabdus sp. TaxID=1872524 RepID=UPI002FC9426B
MKRILVYLIAFCLVGCTQSTQPLMEQMKASLERANQMQAIDGDNRKDFYSYYIEPSIGKISSSPSSNVFVKNGVRFVMNLNVSKIINEKYYADALTMNDIATSENLLFSLEGQYEDILLNIYDYVCEVYQYESLTMVLLSTQFMDFYAVGNEDEVVAIVSDMLKIAKTVQINKEEIVAAYSSKEAVQYKKQALNLFEVAVPENGRVDEMISDKTGTSNENGNSGNVGDDFATDDIGNRVPTPTPTPETPANGDENYASDDIG